MKTANIEWLNIAFEKTSDALYILKDQQVVRKNQAAQKLETLFKIDLKKIIEICQFKGCSLHSIMTSCQDCAVKESSDQNSFSLVLQTHDGEQIPFSASYTIFDSDQNGQILSIRNLTAQIRTSNLLQQKKLVAYVTKAHEKERKKLSQDLHDGLAQSVFSTMLEIRKLKWLAQEETTDITAHIDQVEALLADTLDEIKNMALDLRPSVLDDLGLIPAIRTLIQRLERTTGVTIHFVPHTICMRFSEKIEITLYRLLQEALTNAIKYAQIDEIDVLLLEKETMLILEINDQGIGFNPLSPNIQGTGMGLFNMKERVLMLNGHFKLVSAPNKGTQIRVEIPIQEVVHNDSSFSC